MTKADKKRVETIARACGWEYENKAGLSWVRKEVEYWNPFNPFRFESDWFRAFDAMGLDSLRLEVMDGAVWECEVSLVSLQSAEHPDRLTAMGEALYQAAKAKLGEVGG